MYVHKDSQLRSRLFHKAGLLGPARMRTIEQVKRLKELELENNRLRKAVSDLTLDKLILQEAARRNF